MPAFPSWLYRDVIVHVSCLVLWQTAVWLLYVLQSVLCMLACLLLAWLWPHAVVIDALAAQVSLSPWARSLVGRWRLPAAVLWASLALLCCILPGCASATVHALSWSPLAVAKAIATGAMEVARGLLRLACLVLEFWSGSTALVYYGGVVFVAWMINRQGHG